MIAGTLYTALKTFVAAMNAAGVDTTRSDRALARADAGGCTTTEMDNDIQWDIAEMFKTQKP